MEIRSVQRYLSIIENSKEKYTYSTSIHSLMPAQLHRPKFIYRGHGNESYQLLPGIFRWHEKENGTSVSEYSQMEHTILQDFIGEACRYIKDVSTEDIHAWLEIAQHFSVPTRLLDFTENPLVALYFACADINETMLLSGLLMRRNIIGLCLISIACPMRAIPRKSFQKYF